MNRLIVIATMAGFFSVAVEAHHPDRAKQPVRMRGDCIGPIGSNMRPSYRRVYNRPTNLQGKIAYLIAPTSQEAIVWHRETHRCAYERDLPRHEPLYFYPKPWEALQIGPRKINRTESSTTATESFDSGYGSQSVSLGAETIEPLPPAEVPLGDPMMLPEDKAIGSGVH